MEYPLLTSVGPWEDRVWIYAGMRRFKFYSVVSRERVSIPLHTQAQWRGCNETNS